MVYLSSRFLKIILTLILLPAFNLTRAQSAMVNVEEAFNAISNKPFVIHLKNDTVTIPAGGHLQGIQRLSDSVLIITASSNTISYYLVGKFSPSNNTGQINELQKIAPSPYRHAGGCQLNEGKLVVGMEDNIAKNKSFITMFTFSSSPPRVGKQLIVHRQGIVKRSTAGAVGFTKTKTEQYLVAVGDWDSRNIDFYLSRNGRYPFFDSLTTFHAPDNKKWCSYQSINLLSDTAGNIYLVGFALDGLKNRADLFKVGLEKNAARLNLISTRNFKCKGGASFRYGAGIEVSGKQSLTIYSCARNAGKQLAVNIFKHQ